MSARTLYRLSGVSLLLGSILSVIYYFAQSFLSDTDPKALTSSLFLISSLIGFIGALLVLLGLPGMPTYQAGRAGILGLLGFLCVSYIFLMQGVLVPFTSVTIVPELAANPTTLPLAVAPPPAMAPFFLASMLAEFVGPLLLAIATLRARVFPRWIGWLLLATVLLGVMNVVPFFPAALLSLPPIMGSVAIAGFGYALLEPGYRTSLESAPATTGAQVPV